MSRGRDFKSRNFLNSNVLEFIPCEYLSPLKNENSKSFAMNFCDEFQTPEISFHWHENSGSSGLCAMLGV